MIDLRIKCVKQFLSTFGSRWVGFPVGCVTLFHSVKNTTFDNTSDSDSVSMSLHHEPRPGRRRVLSRFHRIAIRLIIVVVTLEVASFVFLNFQRKQNSQLFYFDIDSHVKSLDPNEVMKRKHAAETKHIWSPDLKLGWMRTPLSSYTVQVTGTTINTDAKGARVIPDSVGPISLATYGDSFTECIEVGDAETWQAFIAYATGTRVLNYGVSAFGPDQALLSLEQNLERGIRSPVVILAMINENFNRIMNSYCEFYTYPARDVLLGFKPIFVKTDTGFVVRSFAPDDITDNDALRRSLWAASKEDWFYQSRSENLKFPFSIRAAGFIVRNGPIPRRIFPDQTTGLAKQRMAYILTRFVKNARQHKFTPVFVLLPQNVRDLRTRNGGDHPPPSCDRK